MARDLPVIGFGLVLSLVFVAGCFGPTASPLQLAEPEPERADVGPWEAAFATCNVLHTILEAPADAFADKVPEGFTAAASGPGNAFVELVAFGTDCAGGNLTGANGATALDAGRTIGYFLTVRPPEEVQNRDLDVTRHVVPVHIFLNERGALDAWLAWGFADAAAAATVDVETPVASPGPAFVSWRADDRTAAWAVDATLRRDQGGLNDGAMRAFAVTDGAVGPSVRIAWTGGGGDGGGPATFTSNGPAHDPAPARLAGTAVAGGGMTVTVTLDRAA